MNSAATYKRRSLIRSENVLNEPPELLQPAVHEQGNTESVCLSVAHRAFTETQSVQNRIYQSHCEKYNHKYILGN